MSPRSVVVVLLVGGMVGCGQKSDTYSFVGSSIKPPGNGEHAKPPAGPMPAQVQANAGGGADPAAVGAVPPAPTQPQMIIYTATLDVVVKDLDAARAEVEKLVATHKGYVAKSEVKGDPGAPRTATFAIRVPVAGYSPVREGALGLGHAERNSVDTQDVGEEFVDVEARIKNLQDQESKLNELLKEKRKEEKLEDVIKVSDRIYVVRGDIERAQGRRNYLLNRVQLSTINLTLREVKDYKPPTEPTFGARISETFGTSWDALVDFGKSLVLFGVALAPWTPIWLPLLVAGIWAVRRELRMRRALKTSPPEAGPPA